MMRWTQQVLLIFVVLFINSQTAESQLPTPNVFAVRGAVYTADGVTLAGDGFGVMVENVTKGLIREDLTGSTAGPSRYVVAFVDFNTPVVDDSDLIQVTVTQEATGEVLATKQVIVTPTDLGAGFLVLDLNFTSSSDGSYVLAILGQILLSDGIPAGDGLTVTVENLSQGVRQTDVTGTYAGPSRYVVTFVDTETPVANAGDEIEIRVEDALGLMLGNTRVTLSTDAL
ncbi:hypothetical protein IH992_09015, partial [Candidatus Poribacteria bacterium]|nr:hypothetical protein [Candidatus Poribacteria bacterium]